jgi:hypothetical protein
MGIRQVNEGCDNTARVEISTTLLAQLICSGALSCNECRCLDNNARKTLWQSLLNVSTSLKTTLNTGE